MITSSSSPLGLVLQLYNICVFLYIALDDVYLLLYNFTRCNKNDFDRFH